MIRQEKLKKIDILLEQGVQAVDIAKSLGVSRITVCKRYQKMHHGRIYSKRKWEQFVKLYEAKFSLIEIAYFLRMNKGSIQRFARRYNNGTS